MAATAPIQQDVGRALRGARQRNHVQLEDAASTTRIPKRYLEALEGNAPLDTYPAPMYARAFLREYARYLALDPEPLVAGFGGEPVEAIRLDPASPAIRAPRRWPARVLLVMSIGGLVGLAVVGVLNARDETVPFGSTAPPAAVTQPATMITAGVHILGPSWVRVVADGTLVVHRTFTTPSWHRFTARRTLDVTLRDAARVRMVLNGTRVPTGPPGRVVHLSIALHRGKLHVTRA
jgi:hypothetical protein